MKHLLLTIIALLVLGIAPASADKTRVMWDISPTWDCYYGEKTTKSFAINFEDNTITPNHKFGNKWASKIIFKTSWAEWMKPEGGNKFILFVTEQNSETSGGGTQRKVDVNSYIGGANGSWLAVMGGKSKMSQANWALKEKLNKKINPNYKPGEYHFYTAKYRCSPS